MPAYNKTFDLTPDELELIESALRDKQRQLSANMNQPCETLKDTHELLGRLHNQKNFYRPKQQAYIGG